MTLQEEARRVLERVEAFLSEKSHGDPAVMEELRDYREVLTDISEELPASNQDLDRMIVDDARSLMDELEEGDRDDL